MANVKDVADYILSVQGPMSAMKLQKLVYYSQAWHLTWSDKPLFDAEIQAWMNGPVVPQLYHAHKGMYVLEPGLFGGNVKALSEDEQDTVARVLKAYGSKSSQWLSDLTHAEPPWREARIGIPDGERGDTPIDLASMAEYYSSL